jgi:hypothetical protein
MVDVNLFSSKTDVKKLLFTTEKFHVNSHLSDDSWQDFASITHPSCHEYSIVEKAHGQHCSTTNYCRLDHWLAPASTHCSSRLKPIDVKNNCKRQSNESIVPVTERTFADSCESLTVSIDLHVPTDELMTDHDDIDGQDMVVWRKKLQENRNTSSNDTHCTSR